MLDTGADINIIKLRALDPATLIYTEVKVEIQGISKERLQTLGITCLHSNTGAHEFHVVTNEFPLKEPGIIGSTFLRKENAKIDFEKQTVTISNSENLPIEFSKPITLPSRSICPIVIQTKQIDADIGLLTHREIHPGVFLLDSIVKMNQGETYTYAINTTEKELRLEIPEIEVEPVEIATSPRDSSTYRVNPVISTNLLERVKLLRENLKLEHLNKCYAV